LPHVSALEVAEVRDRAAERGQAEAERDQEHLGLAAPPSRRVLGACRPLARAIGGH
jgi:hypothetical protein